MFAVRACVASLVCGLWFGLYFACDEFLWI